ncbi:MAG: thiosulfate oxidation carrier complex protein SoxZ [Pseudomonadota bacterium]|jgi:sulfur-oxidizing protein SoxZ
MDTTDTLPPPEPTRLRARRQADGRTALRLLAAHPMETGQRIDADGRRVPAWIIQTLTLRLRGRTVLRWHCGTAVAQNPYLELTLRDAQVGDTIEVDWVDSLGRRRNDRTTVA